MIDLIKELKKPSFYGSNVRKVKLVETHISWVFLTGKHAFKVKKPVNFGFLDFSTLAKRKHFCKEEIKLNKRLSKGLYLGVIPITQSKSGKLKLGGAGKTVEYAVKMKQLPEKNKMDVLLRKNKVSRKQIAQISRVITKFHSKTKTIQSGYGSPAQIKADIFDLRRMRNIIAKNLGKKEAKKVDFILKKSGQFLKKNAPLLKYRVKKGKIKACHGDLHSANIFLTKKPFIFDCIEFNKQFRFIDVASEIAFMCMDLDAFGKKSLSNYFVEQYIAFSKDQEIEFLLPFYKCYRANVRAKINAIQLSQGLNKKAQIKSYLALAEKYAKEF